MEGERLYISLLSVAKECVKLSKVAYLDALSRVLDETYDWRCDTYTIDLLITAVRFNVKGMVRYIIDERTHGSVTHQHIIIGLAEVIDYHNDSIRDYLWCKLSDDDLPELTCEREIEGSKVGVIVTLPSMNKKYITVYCRYIY